MRDLGDFQTPLPLVREIVRLLDKKGGPWERVLEPNCGSGNFIAGLLDLEVHPREIKAFEVQENYVQQAREIPLGPLAARTHIQAANIFQIDFGADLEWTSSGPLLVIGNPPWVTNSELGGLSSANVPVKTNLRGLRGIDALTGESNFDIAEHIWIKLITELAGERPTIAMLCKTTVARNVLRWASNQGISVMEASMFRINARRWFRAAVEACLFVVRMGARAEPLEAKVYPSLTSTSPEGVLSVQNGAVVSESAFTDTFAIDGSCSMVWRQGIKHDAAKLMELEVCADMVRNRLGEEVDVECEYVYPLLKGSDLFNQAAPKPRFSVIVTQKHLTEDTRELEKKAPKLWKYLQSHEKDFAKRKSSIYVGRPPFCMFGVGDYSFAEYKVAIAGFYKQPRFRALGPFQGRPIMLDDTCYFVACESAQEAAMVSSLLNDPVCERFLGALIFGDSKRPVTKGVLKRIDLERLRNLVNREMLQERFETEYRRLTQMITSEGSPDSIAHGE